MPTWNNFIYVLEQNCECLFMVTETFLRGIKLLTFTKCPFLGGSSHIARVSRVQFWTPQCPAQSHPAKSILFTQERDTFHLLWAGLWLQQSPECSNIQAPVCFPCPALPPGSCYIWKHAKPQLWPDWRVPGIPVPLPPPSLNHSCWPRNWLPCRASSTSPQVLPSANTHATKPFHLTKPSHACTAYKGATPQMPKPINPPS